MTTKPSKKIKRNLKKIAIMTTVFQKQKKRKENCNNDNKAFQKQNKTKKMAKTTAKPFKNAC